MNEMSFNLTDSATESAKEDEQLQTPKTKEKQTIQKVSARARSKSPAPPGMQGNVNIRHFYSRYNRILIKLRNK